MAKIGNANELFTASEVAKFCQVDLKTIHNWADRGEIRHFRTPGRHLRFKRVDVIDFLRKYGYPVPEALLQGKMRVHLVVEDKAALAMLQRTLAHKFDVRAFSDPVDALIAIGSELPDVVVLDLDGPQPDGLKYIDRLRASDSTRHIRFVAYTAQEGLKERALQAGASAAVTKPDAEGVSKALEALMGS
jgi:excisionase family DNA binding protein